VVIQEREILREGKGLLERSQREVGVKTPEGISGVRKGRGTTEGSPECSRFGREKERRDRKDWKNLNSGPSDGGLLRKKPGKGRRCISH